MLINKIENKNKGFSLIELLAVVGIGGALVAGALLLISDVQTKRKIKVHSENISSIFTNMDTIFSDESMTSSITNETLVIAGVYPNTLKIQSGGDVRNLGGGAVEITPSTSGDGYELDYPKVSASTCVEVLKNQKRVGWEKWNVVAGNSSGAATKRFDDPADSSVDKIAAACLTASTGDWVSLSFSIE